MTGFSIQVPPELVETIAQRVAEILRDESRAAATPEWLTLEEAAERLRLTPAAARKRALRGTLAGAVKDGTRWLVDGRALEVSLGHARFGDDRRNRGERRANGPAPGTEGSTSDA